jgi:hypothetical protein
MGYYIEVNKPRGKAKQIVDQFSGQIISKPSSYKDIPEDKALIVVVDNYLFEAAGYTFDEREFEAFTDSSDARPKEYVLIDKKIANHLTGYGE